MSLPKVFTLAAAAFSLVGLNCVASGQESLTFSGTATYVPVQVTLREEAIIGWQQIHRMYVTAGTNKWAFCVPDNFHVDTSNPYKVVLVQADYNCFLSIRILTPIGGDLAPEYCRRQLSDAFPEANVTGEFAQRAGATSGPGFDLQWTNSNSVPQSARVAYFPSPAGVVELVLLSKSEKFTESRRFFDFLRASYCSDQSGPIMPIQAPKEPPRN